MTISRSINSEINLLIIRYEAVITFADMKEHMLIVQGLVKANPELRSILIINDNTDMSQVSGDDFITLTTHAPLLKAKQPNIIVAPDKLLFGLSRLFSSYSDMDSQGMKVVTKIEDACHLLDLTIEQLDQTNPTVNKSHC